MSSRFSHLLTHQFPAVVWAIVIFLTSSIPASKFPNMFIFQYDKLIHISIFLVLGLLVYRALEFRKSDKSFDFERALVVIFCVVVYGASDEWHQSFVPGRIPDIWDATADTVGGILAVIIIYFVSARRMRASTGSES